MSSSSTTEPGDGIRADIEAARAGSAEALGRLLERCRPFLMLIASEELDSGLRAKAGASDLVQESCLDAQRDFTAFRGSSEAELLGWLRQVLRHNLADFHRRYREAAGRQLRQEPLSAEASEQLLRKLAGDTPGPQSRAADTEATQALEAALDQLPEDYRQVLRLRHLEGRTFPEIAAELNRSVGAVHKLWARALERLRLLKENRDESR